MSDTAKISFHGVRGSVPSPLTSADVAVKITEQLQRFVAHGGQDVKAFVKTQLAQGPYTYGGNTSCVSVRYDDQIIVLDMGTGLRPLGNSLFGEMFANSGLAITFIVSHVHWDHIQGLPFFGPLYINQATGIENRWHFLGGTTWHETAEAVLQGQMDTPTFPVSWQEIQKLAAEMTFTDVHDMMSFSPNGGRAEVTMGKLNHPQETYGSRIILPNGSVVVYTTDNEPFDPRIPDPRLLRLANDASVWITDCQYTRDQYNGIGSGVPRHGWGHSYPEAVATTALEAGVGIVVLFHHDPGSSDGRIAEIAEYTQDLITTAGGNSRVVAAYEGLIIEI